MIILGLRIQIPCPINTDCCLLLLLFPEDVQTSEHHFLLACLEVRGQLAGLAVCLHPVGLRDHTQVVCLGGEAITH